MSNVSEGSYCFAPQYPITPRFAPLGQNPEINPEWRIYIDLKGWWGLEYVNIWHVISLISIFKLN